MLIRIALVLLVLAASGCAAMPFGGPPTFVPQAAPGQDVKENPYAGGVALQSVGTHSMARLQQVLGDNLEEHGALFKVVVLNTGAEALSFGEEDVEVVTAGKPGALISRSRLVELENEKKASGESFGSLLKVGAVVGGIVATVATGLSGDGQLSQSQMEGASQSIAGGMVSSMEAGNKAQEASTVASDARLELYDLIALQRQMLEPGQSSGGYFIVQAPGFTTSETEIALRLGQDRHVFRFKPKLF